MFGSGEDTDYFHYEAPQPRVRKSTVVSEMRLKLDLLNRKFLEEEGKEKIVW